MSKLREDVRLRAEELFSGVLPEERQPAGEDTRTALVFAIETLVHEGYLSVMPQAKECPECRGSKMTEGTIGFFACLRCGGRGRVPV